MGFVTISYPFQQCKNFENRLTFDKVTESLKVGIFLGQCSWFVSKLVGFNVRLSEILNRKVFADTV